MRDGQWMRCLRKQMSCCLKLHQNRALLSRPAVAGATRCLDPTQSMSGDPAPSARSELHWTIHRMLPDRSYLSHCSSLLSLQMILETRAGHTLPKALQSLSGPEPSGARPLSTISGQLSIPGHRLVIVESE